MWSGRRLTDTTTEYAPGGSWQDVADGLLHDAELRSTLSAVVGREPGIFWECPPTSRSRAQAPFRFVTVTSPAVAALRPDRTPFAAHLDAAQGLVATFDNLGHDATLIAPCGAVPSGCAHLASWCRTAPPEEQHAFWRAVGQAVQAWWRRSDAPLWLSTSGLGVHWLHVRLDERPKYITHRPYRTLPPEDERP